MKNTEPKKNILVLHGPNMNLVGLKFKGGKNRITIDKINQCLRKEAQKIKSQLKIIQTNDEGAAVTVLQKQRNKISGIILFPGPWQKSAHVLKNTLDLLQVPYITVSTGEKADILSGIANIKETDLLKSCKIALVNLAGSKYFK